MTATITFEDLVKMEQVAATAAAQTTNAGINEFIPKNLTDALANAVNKFAEDPEKFVQSLEKLTNRQQQPTQPIYTQPPEPKRPPQPRPAKQQATDTEFKEPTDQTETEPTEPTEPVQINFDRFYDRMTEGLEDVLNTAGDLPLSAIVDLLKSNPTGCKEMLKPYFMEWVK